MKTRLNLDAVSVESFEAGGEAPELRGTVLGHEHPTPHCNSRIPHCLTPSVYRPCITQDAECI